MNPILYLLYRVILLFIFIYKWIEFQILKLISPWLRKKGMEIFENIGVVLHLPGEESKWSEEDEKRALSKCERYDSLVHIKVNTNAYFARVANLGTLAAGETYMDKSWDYMKSEDDIVQAVKRTMENSLMDHYWHFMNRFFEWIELDVFNLQTKQRALQVGKEHYDLGNDLYELMLDDNMQYTCGYWARADNLNQAQLDKMELIAKKLDLKPGMRVLDIGCGWGYLCKYLTENYKVECVGITISEEGVKYGKKICENLPIDIRLQDYRDVKEKFDRIVSVGMFEHVGHKNYKEYLEIAHRCLKDDGIFLLHTIGTNHNNVPRSERWLHKYIFPNGSLPKPFDITKHTYGLFIIEDWHNFGPDYAKTLRAWRHNFNENWHKISLKYGENFYRMWIYYLAMCEGVFLSRRSQLWQVVLSKDGLQTGYRAAK